MTLLRSKYEEEIGKMKFNTIALIIVLTTSAISLFVSFAYGQEEKGSLSVAITATENEKVPETYDVKGYEIAIEGEIPRLGFQEIGQETQNLYKLQGDGFISINRAYISLITLGNLEINSANGRETETGSFFGFLNIKNIVNEPDGTVLYYFDAVQNSMSMNERSWDNCVGRAKITGSDALLQFACDAK